MKTIAIISQKGGAGKTTIGIHLAVAAGQEAQTGSSALSVKSVLFRSGTAGDHLENEDGCTGSQSRITKRAGEPVCRAR